MESKKDKFRRILTDLVDSGRFIPGIYNYCDRWCERCSQCERCLTFAHEQEMKKECNDPETEQLDNEKFWEQVQLSFEVTLDMISEDAKRLGINLDELSDVEEPEHMESPVEEIARLYGHEMCRWLRVNRDKLDILTSQIPALYDIQDTSSELANPVEIVQWYCFFIEAKLHRAFHDLNSRSDDFDDEFDITADKLGTAKVVVIAVNRSIEALTILFSIMIDQEDEILCFLSQLSKIKKLILETFPAAMEFKRPGFDD